MGRKKREIFTEHDYFHIYSRGNNRQIIFKDKEDKLYFLNKFLESFSNSNNKILILCIMRNHFHTLIESGENNDISKIMHRICSSYAHYYAWKYSHVGHVFQGRFKSKRIETPIGVQNVINYILENPVKEGYSEEPEDYTWTILKGTVTAGDRHHRDQPS